MNTSTMAIAGIPGEGQALERTPIYDNHFHLLLALSCMKMEAPLEMYIEDQPFERLMIKRELCTTDYLYG